MPDELRLRPYQLEAKDRSMVVLGVAPSGGEPPSAVVLLATGLGKTPVLAMVAKDFAPRGRALVLQHREHLVHQTAKQVRRWSGLSVGIEMDAFSCAAPALRPDVVVASVQTLCRRSRLESYERDAFAVVLVDECHHAVSASDEAILDYFPVPRLGTTATPDRHDRQALGRIFKTVAFRMDMREGIRRGWLSPLYLREVRVAALDYSRVRTTAAGDLNERDLERIFAQEAHLQAVAVPLVHHAGGRRTLVFTPSVLNAHQLAAVINRIRPGSAFALHGKSKGADRERTLAAFQAGKLQFLINCGLYLEGFDEPSIECTAIARPTLSRALFAQMIGRGARLSPETGKRSHLVLDFVGNAGKHQLVSAFDVAGGDLEPKVLAAARLAVGEGTSLIDAIDAAQAKAAAEEAARREIEEERRRRIVADVRSHLEEVPTGLEDGPRLERVHARGVTRERVEALRRYGFPDEFIALLTPDQAASYIAQVLARIRGERPPAPIDPPRPRRPPSSRRPSP